MAKRLNRLALIRFGILLALIAAGTVAVLLVGIPDAATLRENFAQAGVLGVLAFIALYALLSLTPIPASALTIAAGISFGLVRGILVVDVAATIGAIAALYLGRLLGRDAVRGMAGARLDSLDELLSRRGLVSVLLVRMVPIFPFAAVNYASGLTAVKVRDYVIGTAVGILPASVAYVAVGAYGSKPGSLPFVLAVSSLVIVTVVGGVLARRRRQGRTVPESMAPTHEEIR
ncbi:TVP38/TMEM64 family protein [Dermatophilaceae bacterium Sec6.4]